MSIQSKLISFLTTGSGMPVDVAFTYVDGHRIEAIAEGLTETERSMLRFAVERAVDAAMAEPDEFTPEEMAALESLGQIARNDEETDDDRA